jgi:hypothetical protein
VGSDGRSIRFNFTGLIIFEVFESFGRMVASLVDGMRNLDVPHTTLLIVRVRDYVLPEDTEHLDDELIYQPQFVRLGDEAFALWGLEGYKLWIGPSGSNFKDSGSLTFPRWNGRDLFPTAAQVQEQAQRHRSDLKLPDYIDADEHAVNAQIAIAGGEVRGLVPLTACERNREYWFNSGDHKSYAAEFAVDYPVDSDTIDLRVVPLRHPQAAPSIIRLRPRDGAAVSIVNSPIHGHSEMKGHVHSDAPRSSHFGAYSKVLYPGKSVLVDVSWNELPECDGIQKANPPDPGCIPLYFEHEKD